MPADWITSPTARRILVHWADTRPAWLWSPDGQTLVWRNDAARYFQGKLKKHGLKPAPPAVPIRGQISRLIRLGTIGRSSLSRIQFLAGDRPVSTTCMCTPLDLPDGETGLLIVGVDPIDSELLEANGLPSHDPWRTGIFPGGAEYLLVSEDGQIADGTERALADLAPLIESDGVPPLDARHQGSVELNGMAVALTRIEASQHGAILLVFGPKDSEQEVAQQDRPVAPTEPEQARADVEEPMLPMGLPPAPATTQPRSEVETESAQKPLASLFDRLMADDDLYTPLTAEDEQFDGAPPAHGAVLVDTGSGGEDQLAAVEPDMIGALIEYADDPEALAPPEPQPAAGAVPLWRVTGRDFVPAAAAEDPVLPDPAEPQDVGNGAAAALAPRLVEDDPDPAAEPERSTLPPDAALVERVSRYNFDELSRILTDRVGDRPGREPAAEPPAPVSEGSLVNLASETVVLNRLPLGVLVFRDQQVLFANRALIDLTGHESVEGLRAGGVGGIFPAEDHAAGPVTHLVGRGGQLIPVQARLQSVTWHGRSALMLSASLRESHFGHEGAVRTFSEMLAAIREEGYVSADRAGVITSVSLHARILTGKDEDDLVGRPLASLLDPAESANLKAFLERPARFAETARPAFLARGDRAGVQVELFAEGQAGIVSGYFGFVRRLASGGSAAASEEAAGARQDAALVARLSRAMRGPLNTVVGFSDMIGSGALGPTGDPRYAEYARDIRAAGAEIVTLVEELDDYARLNDGRYPLSSAAVELAPLLEGCVARVRGQALLGKVLVRTAISEGLPQVHVDRASTSQAVLNLLSSAISRTPQGGSVIVSSQQEDDGTVTVHLRDGGERRGDLADRFMVFRDGIGASGETLTPVRSTMGLALTRSLLAVNALTLSVDPAAGAGTLFSLRIPAKLVAADP